MSIPDRCQVCEKRIDLSQAPVPDADEVILFNFLLPMGCRSNICILLCSNECKKSYTVGFFGCVVCGEFCTSDHWNMHVKFVNLGGWTSVRTACSHKCKERILKEETSEIELLYQCWYCHNTSESPLLKCSKCNVAYYCDEKCQKVDSEKHNPNCKSDSTQNHK